MPLLKYFCNCFLLLIPIFLWNIIFVDYLPKAYSPAIFWKDIPLWLKYSENILRTLVFVLPLLMKLSLKTSIQKTGMFFYLIGLVLYFSSWIILMISPLSEWSQHLMGFMAPAFTTIIWFIGIGLIGHTAFFKIPKMSFIYILSSILFVFFHTTHTYLVFQTIHP